MVLADGFHCPEVETFCLISEWQLGIYHFLHKKCSTLRFIGDDLKLRNRYCSQGLQPWLSLPSLSVVILQLSSMLGDFCSFETCGGYIVWTCKPPLKFTVKYMFQVPWSINGTAKHVSV